LNGAEVEVDSRDHEGTDRNEKESQPLAIFPTDAPRQRFRAHEAPGTPAKAYERRVANHELQILTHMARQESGKWMHYANAAACRRLSNWPLPWGIVPSETKVYCPIADPQIVHTGPGIPDCSCRGI
jgi:hypothetical protein